MRNKISWVTMSMAIMAFTTVIYSCKKDTFEEIPGVCPLVIRTNPERLATGVPLNQIITATFNESMNPATINQTTFSLSSGSKLPGYLSYNESNNTLSFNPDAPLSPNTTYTGRITTGVKDLTGNALQVDYVWTFSTGNTVAPTVIATDPVAYASNVPLNKIITAVFSEPMDASTITTVSFQLKAGSVSIPGVVTYAGNTATFSPNSNLSLNTVYTATLINTIKSVQGTALLNNYTWIFSTGTLPGAPWVDLKSVARFGIISGTGVSNNAGASEIRNLDVGISPGARSSVTGFPPGVIFNGAIYASDDALPAGVAAMLIQAKQDLTDAYLYAEGATSPVATNVAGDIGGTTLAPGIYKSTSGLMVQAGDLTLDAKGDANAIWIFQIKTDLTTFGGAGGNIILSGGAKAENIFWQVGSSATIGNGTRFKGNILALTSITMNSTATITGRLLARNGAVVLINTNVINKP